MSEPSASPIRIGISACLLGQPVRFNGGHKQSRLCSEVLARHVEFVPVCPEQAVGLGVPREPIRLVGDPAAPHARGTKNPGLDATAALDDYGRATAERLGEIGGFILMQKSPSCGMERVRVYREDGRVLAGHGRGVFAAALMRARPELPIEEDGRLNDPVLCENFLTRVFAYAEWQRLLREGLSRQALIDFHTRYKYQLMAVDPVQYRLLGRLVAGCRRQSLEELAPRYFAQLMAAMRTTANRGTHSNVLQHLCGYLKRSLGSAEKQELQQLIEQYRQGIVPLVVPLTLIKHHFRRHPDAYIERQAYLQPHPEALGLRNAI